MSIQPNIVDRPAIYPNRAHTAETALCDDLRAMVNTLLDSEAYSLNVPSQPVARFIA